MTFVHIKEKWVQRPSIVCVCAGESLGTRLYYDDIHTHQLYQYENDFAHVEYPSKKASPLTATQFETQAKRMLFSYFNIALALTGCTSRNQSENRDPFSERSELEEERCIS